jgi:actin-like ATPase involved in cell morphogenesis
MPERIRITHPAQWGPVRRNALLSAARQAGMGNVVLVPEPIAAAAHFASFPGRGLGPGQALAVYDLGAGTFDVGIVGVNQQGFVVLAEAGLPDLGGLDVDQALLDHIGRQVGDQAAWHRLSHPIETADRRAARTVREDVTSAKEALSAHPQTEVALPAPFEDVLVTRAELEALIRPNLVRSVELLAATIRAAGLTPDRLAGVYLVGGSSRIPLVAKLITEHLRVVPTSLDLPECTVALGAHQVPELARATHTAQVSQPLPVGAPTGGFPAPPPQLPPPVPQQQWAQPVPMQRPLRKPNRALPWLAAVVGLALVAAVAIFVVRGLGGKDGADIADCSGQPNPEKVASCIQALAAPFSETHNYGPDTNDSLTCVPNDPSNNPKLEFQPYESAADMIRFIGYDMGGVDLASTGSAWSGGGISGRFWLPCAACSDIGPQPNTFVLVASVDQPYVRVRVEFSSDVQAKVPEDAGRRQLSINYFLTKLVPKG